MLLIVIGHMRDFFGKKFRPENYKDLLVTNVSHFTTNLKCL